MQKTEDSQIAPNLNGPGTMILLSYISGRELLRKYIKKVQLFDVGGFHELRLTLSDGKSLIHTGMRDDHEVYNFIHNIPARFERIN